MTCEYDDALGSAFYHMLTDHYLPHSRTVTNDCSFLKNREDVRTVFESMKELGGHAHIEVKGNSEKDDGMTRADPNTHLLHSTI